MSRRRADNSEDSRRNSFFETLAFRTFIHLTVTVYCLLIRSIETSKLMV